MSVSAPAPRPAASLADTLAWGHGPRVLEVFLEPTCPFSGRAFGKLDALLARAGEDRLTVRIRLQSQPWHLFSPVVCRAVLAAATLPDGRTAARAVLAAVFAHREQFDHVDHASGPNLDLTLREVIGRIEALSGLALADAFAAPGLDRDLKWQARYARQNGIHATPTFMVDGLVAPDIGSGDSVDAWLDKLGLA
ncbi:DsbA family protein [Sphaerotilus mobilis]|uniref:Thioredoxin-like protein n=1 Tax=Sphaerotilus mobilis TaxID=47994 RepID=A0A4Q7LW14_9BURK|nr:thioredoxin domain-containing protein [Sphaerotilus mobilis]RZS58572.1 thioredoxin-like protein [Sphaerotilus mobilis]